MIPPQLSQNAREALKQQAAVHAVGFVQSGMVVGLGSGTTAIFATREIARLLRAGLLRDIVGVPTSKRVELQARELGIPLVAPDADVAIDLTIDGADEIDADFQCIKGGGGALLHEKIVAQLSRREVIVVDEGKLSPRLGTRWPVPLEVLDFAAGSTRRFLESLSARVELRRQADGREFRTDEGNLIFDCHFGPIDQPAALATRLAQRAGIVEHGLFLDLVTDLVVAGSDGIRHSVKQST